MQYSPANTGGRHPHPYIYGNPSYHPPGLPVPPPPPPPLAPPVLQPRTEELIAASPFADIFQLDEFWRGRLAPLPGYQSRPGLVPLKERKQTQIDFPTLPLTANNYQKNALPTLTNNNTEVSFCYPSSRVNNLDLTPQKEKKFQFDKYVSPLKLPSSLKAPTCVCSAGRNIRTSIP